MLSTDIMVQGFGTWLRDFHGDSDAVMKLKDEFVANCNSLNKPVFHTRTPYLLLGWMIAKGASNESLDALYVAAELYRVQASFKRTTGLPPRHTVCKFYLL